MCAEIQSVMGATLFANMIKTSQEMTLRDCVESANPNTPHFFPTPLNRIPLFQGFPP